MKNETRQTHPLRDWANEPGATGIDTQEPRQDAEPVRASEDPCALTADCLLIASRNASPRRRTRRGCGRGTERTRNIGCAPDPDDCEGTRHSRPIGGIRSWRRLADCLSCAGQMEPSGRMGRQTISAMCSPPAIGDGGRCWRRDHSPRAHRGRTRAKRRSTGTIEVAWRRASGDLGQVARAQLRTITDSLRSAARAMVETAYRGLHRV